MAQDLKEANERLLDAAARLVEEWPDVPTGSVLRCFSRAVWIVRGAGCPPDRLAAESSRLASALLELRGATGSDGPTMVRGTAVSRLAGGQPVPAPRMDARRS